MESESDGEGSLSLSDSGVAHPDFIESTSEGEHFSSSDEGDAELFECVLETAYSSNAPLSVLNPAERDSLLLFDKNLSELGKMYTCVLKGYAFS